jgi:hypothetical protein
MLPLSHCEKKRADLYGVLKRKKEKNTRRQFVIGSRCSHLINLVVHDHNLCVLTLQEFIGDETNIGSLRNKDWFVDIT